MPGKESLVPDSRSNTARAVLYSSVSWLNVSPYLGGGTSSTHVRRRRRCCDGSLAFVVGPELADLLAENAGGGGNLRALLLDGVAVVVGSERIRFGR